MFELHDFDLSARTLAGVINDARAGHILTPEAWRSQNPETGQISPAKGVLFIIVALIVIAFFVWNSLQWRMQLH
jgi:hypothetical protein